MAGSKSLDIRMLDVMKSSMLAICNTKNFTPMLKSPFTD